MSQAGRFSGGGPTPPGTAIQTVTGDTGGPVGPTAGNINLLTADTTVQFNGSPGTSTITQDFGLSNLIIGSDATGITVGLQNVGLGLTALDNITAGSSNIGIGAGALFNNTSGSNNVAVGSSALLSNITANQNVAIGTSALINSNAFGNIAIGHQTLFSNTTGINNVAISPLALTANVSGNDNIAIGLGTLLNNVSGISNIGIGSGVLVANTNNENIGIGQGSLASLTTGFNNIAIGVNAGNAYTGAESNNITLGLVGVVGESNVTRVANIYGDTIGATNALVFIDNTGHLGTVGGGAGALITLTGNTGGAVPPTANNITIATLNATVEFVGNPGLSTLTQDFGLVNLILGSSPLFAGGVDNAGFGDNVFTAVISGSQNTAIGNDAVTSLTTGSDNVAIGFDALDSLVSGDRNIAIGSTAGSTYTGGESDNIIIGATGILGDSGIIRIGTGPTVTEAYVAGIYGSTVGATNAPVFIDNTGKLGTMGGGTGDVLTLTGNTGGAISPDAMGNINIVTTNSTPIFSGAGNTLTVDFDMTNLVLGSSLPALAGGMQNVGLGSQVLNALTTGVENVAVGWRAGISLTSGSANTALGNFALHDATTPASNLALGNSALRSITTTPDDANTAVGTLAMSLNTAGNRNTAVGFAAYRVLGTGSFNICIGGGDGVSVSNNGAGSSLTGADSSNILISNFGTAGDNNTIRIGTQGSGNAQQDSCFIAGIANVTVANQEMVVIDTTTGELGSEPIPIGLLPWTVVTGASQAMAVNNGYIANNAGTINFSLPASSVVGDIIRITGINNATGIQITQGAGQQIFFGATSTTLGAGGSLTSTDTRDSIEIVCVVANTIWNVLSSIGNWTVV